MQAFDILPDVRHGFKSFDSDLPRIKKFSLANVANMLGFKHNAHNVLSDSEVTAEIQLYLSKKFPDMDVTLYVAKSSTILDKINNDLMSNENILVYQTQE